MLSCSPRVAVRPGGEFIVGVPGLTAEWGALWLTSYKFRTSAGEYFKARGVMDILFGFAAVPGKVVIAFPRPFEYGAPERNVPRLPDL